MKENFYAVIFANTHSTSGESLSQKQVLYTPSIDWLKLTLHGLSLNEKSILIYGTDVSDTTKPQLTDYVENAQENILVLSGDIPLITKQDIENSFNSLGKYGLLLVSGDIMPGVGWYKKDVLLRAIKDLPETMTAYQIKDKAGKDSYEKFRVNSSLVTSVESPVNNNIINQKAKQMVIDKHLNSGVEIPISDGVVISPEVQIQPGATILSGTIIKGNSEIGSASKIGPNSVLENAIIGSNVWINASHIENAVVNNDSVIGPMVRIRPDSNIGKGVKLGNFVEIKNSNIGDETSVAHLTYVGDSDVGSGCNIGCGVVTVNYDGKNKHRTTIGNNVFVGCNCNLVAPVTLEDESYIAAGTTVTENVPPKALAIGRSRQENKENWTKNKNIKKKP